MQKTLERKDLQAEFHTQAYLSSMGSDDMKEIDGAAVFAERSRRGSGGWDRKHGKRWEDENTRR